MKQKKRYRKLEQDARGKMQEVYGKGMRIGLEEFNDSDIPIVLLLKRTITFIIQPNQYYKLNRNDGGGASFMNVITWFEYDM